MKENKMKKLKILNILIMIILLTVPLLAGPKKTLATNIEDNLIVGLQSDNLGLKTASAYMLGEYGSSKCVIALMRVLKNGDTEEERISAALALTKINTEKARFAVKQRAKYDESERVRKICEKFSHQVSLDSV
jgi:HEAT repeat protein